MRARTTMMLGCALAIPMTPVLWAQGVMDPNEAPNNQSNNQWRTQADGESTALWSEWNAAPRHVRGSTLQGRTITNRSGQTLGTLDDLVIATRRGNIVAGVIETKKGRKAFPWSSLQVRGSDGKLVVPLTMKQLEDGPTFGDSDASTGSDNPYIEDVYAHFGDWPYWEEYRVVGIDEYEVPEDRFERHQRAIDRMERQAERQAERQDRQNDDARNRNENDRAQNRNRNDNDENAQNRNRGDRRNANQMAYESDPRDTVRLSEIMRATVKGTDAELGTVKDVLINTRSGRARYIVLNPTDSISTDKEFKPVPFRDLKFMKGQKTVQVMNVTASDFKSAPGFERTSWPEDSNMAWYRDTDRAYGLGADRMAGNDAEWKVDDDARNRDRADRPRGERNREMARGSGGWADESQNSMYRQGERVELRGTVKAINTESMIRNMSDAVVVTVEAQDGKTKKVCLGPAWFIDHQDRMVNEGQTVAVTGRTVMMDGTSIVMAQEVRIGNRTMVLRDDSGNPAWQVWKTTAQAGVQP